MRNETVGQHDGPRVVDRLVMILADMVEAAVRASQMPFDEVESPPSPRIADLEVHREGRGLHQGQHRRASA